MWVVAEQRPRRTAGHEQFDVIQWRQRGHDVEDPLARYEPADTHHSMSGRPLPAVTAGPEPFEIDAARNHADTRDVGAQAGQGSPLLGARRDHLIDVARQPALDLDPLVGTGVL